jgi:gamma-glutamyltranspeptidase/glutathione hydrolase
LLQSDLAQTLEGVAAHGAAYMYTGAWGRSYVAAVQAQGGKITPDDLAGYRPEWRAPLSIAFAGATVFGPGEDADRACPTLEALNLMSALKVGAMGPYWTDPAAFEDYAHALRFASFGHYLPQVRAFERAHGFADDCTVRITPAYAKAIAPQLASLMGATPAGGEAGHHSDSVVVIDRWGNVAALVHTINAVVWGDTGIVVAGVPIPDAASINKARLLKTVPGGRLGTEMAPMIALRHQKPVLAVATIGASLVPENVRLTAGLLAQHQDLQQLMTAPPLLLNTEPPTPGQSLLDVPESVPTGAYSPAILKALAGKGGQVRESPLEVVRALRGTAVVGLVRGSDGQRLAVESPEVIGFAEAQ